MMNWYMRNSWNIVFILATRLKENVSEVLLFNRAIQSGVNYLVWRDRT